MFPVGSRVCWNQWIMHINWCAFTCFRVEYLYVDDSGSDQLVPESCPDVQESRWRENILPNMLLFSLGYVVVNFPVFAYLVSLIHQTHYTLKTVEKYKIYLWILGLVVKSLEFKIEGYRIPPSLWGLRLWKFLATPNSIGSFSFSLFRWSDLSCNIIKIFWLLQIGW